MIYELKVILHIYSLIKKMEYLSNEEHSKCLTKLLSHPILEPYFKDYISQLYNMGFDINELNNLKADLREPLFYEWFNLSENCDLLLYLIDHGLDINTVDSEGFNLLNWLVYEDLGSYDTIKFLLEHKANVNNREFIHRQTCVHQVIKYCDRKEGVDVLKLLIEYNVDTNKLTSNNWHPLEQIIDSIDSGYNEYTVETIKILLDRCTKYTELNIYSILITLIYHDFADLLKMFLSYNNYDKAITLGIMASSEITSKCVKVIYSFVMKQFIYGLYDPNSVLFLFSSHVLFDINVVKHELTPYLL